MLLEIQPYSIAMLRAWDQSHTLGLSPTQRMAGQSQYFRVQMGIMPSNPLPRNTGVTMSAMLKISMSMLLQEECVLQLTHLMQQLWPGEQAVCVQSHVNYNLL